MAFRVCTLAGRIEDRLQAATARLSRVRGVRLGQARARPGLDPGSTEGFVDRSEIRR